MKIKIKTFNQPGTYHKSLGMESEDYNKVIVNGDYVYSILSDGFGSTGVGRVAAETTVEATAEFCFKNGEKFFTENSRQVAEELIRFIQNQIIDCAQENKFNPKNLKATFALICIDLKSKQYITINIGDALIMKSIGAKFSIIAFPDNGEDKNSTFSVNSPDVLSHLKIFNDQTKMHESFFIFSDGFFEECITRTEYINKLKFLTTNYFETIDSSDDASYNIIEL